MRKERGVEEHGGKERAVKQHEEMCEKRPFQMYLFSVPSFLSWLQIY